MSGQNPIVSADELGRRRYVLQHSDGDYVEKVTGTGMETVKVHFVFTGNRSNAKVFSYEDLFSRLAISPVGVEFTRGFAGGRLVRVDQGNSRDE